MTQAESAGVATVPLRYDSCATNRCSPTSHSILHCCNVCRERSLFRHTAIFSHHPSILVLLSFVSVRFAFIAFLAYLCFVEGNGLPVFPFEIPLDDALIPLEFFLGGNAFLAIVLADRKQFPASQLTFCDIWLRGRGRIPRHCPGRIHRCQNYQLVTAKPRRRSRPYFVCCHR